MEQSSLTPAALAPQFSITLKPDGSWDVRNSAAITENVEYRNEIYFCTCKTPWQDDECGQDCAHIYAVKQYELSLLEKDLQGAAGKAYADMLLWEIAQIEQQTARIDSAAQHQIKRITLWADREKQLLANRLSFKIEQLRSYMIANNLKTERLSNGTVKLRAQQPAISIDKIQFDFNRREFVRIIPEKYEPDLKAIRAHFLATGEILPGMDVDFRQDKLTYELLPDISAKSTSDHDHELAA